MTAITLKRATAVEGEIVRIMTTTVTSTVFGVLVPPVRPPFRNALDMNCSQLMMLAPLRIGLKLCSLNWLKVNQPDEIQKSFAWQIASNLLVQQPATSYQNLICGFHFFILICLFVDLDFG